eukprot:7370682-Pyramimonas_sp.AAC.1
MECHRCLHFGALALREDLPGKIRHRLGLGGPTPAALIACYHHYRLMAARHSSPPTYMRAMELVPAAQIALRLPLRGRQQLALLR